MTAEPPSAFCASCVFDHVAGKVECVEAWGDDAVIVGTAEGTIQKYVVRPAPASGPQQQQQFTAECDDSATLPHKNRAVVKLAALERLGVLVVLAADGPVTVHDLSRGFALRTVLTKTKGCTAFVVSDPDNCAGPARSSGSGSSSSSSDVVLCAAVKKKVVLYRWDGVRAGSFVELRELGLLDVARTMAWADASVLVGMRREYALVNAVSGAATSLFPMGRTGASPFALRSADDGLLVVRDNVTVFLNLDGSAAREHGVVWTEPPLCFVCAAPFLVALLPKMSVEVRMLAAAAANFAQMIPIRGARAITCKPRADGRGGHVCYIATPTALYRLVQTPLPLLIDRLVAGREFAVALTLCDSLPRDDPASTAKVRAVRLSYAYAMFAQAQFRQSLDLFCELHTDPLAVVALYPQLLPPGFKVPPSSSQQSQQQQEQQQQEQQPQPPDTRDLMMGPTKVPAYKALLAYLLQTRGDVCTGACLASSAAAAPQECDADYRSCAGAAAAAAATVFDTALLKVCVALGDDKQISALCNAPNCCHAGEAAATLAGAGRYTDLVQFYCAKGLHARALELLAAPAGPLADAALVVKYLRRLGRPHKDLVFAHAQRLFRADAALALTVFTENANVNTPDELPRGEVLAFLKAAAPHSVIPYLEFLVADGHETRTEFHDELAFQYLETLRTLYAAAGGYPSTRPYPEPGAEPGAIGAYRRALLHFLETSDHYRPEALLTGMKIPVAGLFEERAVVLSKIGSHDKALAIYALDIGSSAKAEEYCRTHFCEDREDCKDVYLSLLQVYLRPPPAVAGAPPRPTEPMLGPALRLLSEHYQHINITEALGLLPTTTQLSALMPFFERVLSESARQRRDGQIVRALLRSESLRVHEEHIAAAAPYVYVDDSTLCARCHRPLRTSAFVRYPDTGQIVHMMCHQKAEAAGGATTGGSSIGSATAFGAFHADYAAPSPAPAYTPSFSPSFSPPFSQQQQQQQRHTDSTTGTSGTSSNTGVGTAAATIVEDYTASASASPVPAARAEEEEVPSFPGVAACTRPAASSTPSPALSRRAAPAPAAAPVPRPVPAPGAASPQAVSATNPFYDPEPAPAPVSVPAPVSQPQQHQRPALVSTNPFADDFADEPASARPTNPFADEPAPVRPTNPFDDDPAPVRPTNPFDDDYADAPGSTALPPTNPFA